jgi:hypothetical protein
MILGEGLGGLIIFALWVFCFIDVLTTPEQSCRNLPKLAWIFIVLLLPPIGPLAWLIAGRDWDRTLVRAGAPPRVRTAGRGTTATGAPSNPDDDEEFLESLRKRAEEQRRRAAEQQRRERPDQES